MTATTMSSSYEEGCLIGSRKTIVVVEIAILLMLATNGFAIHRARYGGTLRIGVSNAPQSSLPADALSREDWLLVGAVHEQLYRLDPQGAPVINLLAKRPNRTKNKRIWNCLLRSDIRFHSGKSMRAKDVQKSVTKLRKTRFAWIPLFLKVKPTGRFTFRLTLKQTLSDRELGLLLASPALSILPSKASATIGAGPFQVRQWDRHLGTVVLERFEQHHRGAPYLESVRLETARDALEAAEWFRHARVDVVFDDSHEPLDALPDSLFSRAIRLPGPIRESLGIIVNRHRPQIPLTDRQQVMDSAERTVTRDSIAGKTLTSTRLVPKDVAQTKSNKSSSPPKKKMTPWRLGCPTALKKACKAVAYGIPAALTPRNESVTQWPTVSLNRNATLAASQHPERAGWDAVMMSVIHVDPWPLGALHTLATMALGQPTADPRGQLRTSRSWIPLAERRLFLVHAPMVKNLRWSTATLLDMGGVWIQ